MTAFRYKVTKDGEVVDASKYYWFAISVTQYIIPRLDEHSGLSKNYTLMPGAVLHFKEEMYTLTYTTPVAELDYPRIQAALMNSLGLSWEGKAHFVKKKLMS